MRLSCSNECLEAIEIQTLALHRLGYKARANMNKTSVYFYCFGILVFSAGVLLATLDRAFLEVLPFFGLMSLGFFALGLFVQLRDLRNPPKAGMR